MFEIINKHISWVVPLILCAIGWLIKEYFAIKTEMTKLEYKVESQAKDLTELKDAANDLKEAVNRLNINTEVIASWVKLQSGDTLIQRRNHNE